MDSMYDTLLQLPLFQGVSHEIISELVGKTKLHFTKYANDAVILEAGDNQNVLSFVVSGSVTKSYKFPGLEVTINETISAPAVIDAEYLFGIDLRYPFTIYSAGSCGILTIAKDEYMRILQSNEVFIFNILNHLSRDVQNSIYGLMTPGQCSVAGRLSYIIGILTRKSSNDITICYKQRDLCRLLGVRRPSLIETLNGLKNAGIIEFDSSRISIIDRDKLVSRSSEIFMAF